MSILPYLLRPAWQCYKLALHGCERREAFILSTLHSLIFHGLHRSHIYNPPSFSLHPASLQCLFSCWRWYSFSAILTTREVSRWETDIFKALCIVCRCSKSGPESVTPWFYCAFHSDVFTFCLMYNNSDLTICLEADTCNERLCLTTEARFFHIQPFLWRK